jgi:hypothetical protein
MPLDKAHVTRASRIMLPAYPIFFLAFGLGLLLTPTRVMLATPSFRTAADIMPLPTWGAILVGVAAFQAFALGGRRRSTYLAALGVGLVCMVGWVLIFAWAAFQGGAPWTAPMWPAFVAVACVASMVSLEAREV